MTTTRQLQTIDQLKARLDALRPLPPHTVASLHEQLVVEWTYNSNAIEGNTLTLKETKVVLEGITIGGKSMREHFEALNHREAILHVEALVSDDHPLTEFQLKGIHALVLKNIDDDNAGLYRRENVVIAGAEHTPPDHLAVTERMEALFHWYHHDALTLHPVARAAQLHSRLVEIHPFIDGNGRTARLLLNFELIRCGYLPIVIQAADRLDYYEALDRGHVSGDAKPFLEMVAGLEEAALRRYLELIR